MQKRGVSDQLFIYIFILVVIGLVFIFGIKQINNVRELNDKATYLEFKSEFVNAVDNVYNKNKGTRVTYSAQSSNKPIMLPNNVKRISFEMANGKVKVVPSDNSYESFAVNHLRTNLNYLENKNGLSFVLENEVEEGETVVLLKNA
ncbi:hypothetical protein HYT57_03750 [Candidatus Woesearchaeota archaeon]|nr:hypothetical protein [Candidatus Woesearchaeota archaeon]